MGQPRLACYGVSAARENCFQRAIHQHHRPPDSKEAAGGGVMDGLEYFDEVWLVDFEFIQPEGARPNPVCMVGREFRTGRLERLWQHELSEPPFSLGPKSLFVAYFSSAEWNCHLALGWPTPTRILDLFVEFRCLTSGLSRPCGSSLLGAMAYFGLDSIDAAEKDSMRELVMRGGPWSKKERMAVLDYCQTDVDSLAKLLPVMLPKIDIPRGFGFGAATWRRLLQMEAVGIPIDVPLLTKIRGGWDSIQQQLITKIDQDYGVYDGRTFKTDRWAAWTKRNGIDWPRLPSGSLALDNDTFREMARTYPNITPIRELRASLSQLRLNELSVGQDGRNRCFAIPVCVMRTGRNQPSNTKFVFRPSRLVARLNSASPWHGGRLHRLRTAGVWDWGGPFRRSRNAGSVPLGRPIPCLCQAGRCCSTGCYENFTCRRKRTV